MPAFGACWGADSPPPKKVGDFEKTLLLAPAGKQQSELLNDGFPFFSEPFFHPVGCAIKLELGSVRKINCFAVVCEVGGG